jgi:hypothetical protein
MTVPTQAQIDDLISIWSMRPSPLSYAGRAWEAGARQGWQWALEHTTAAQVGEQVHTIDNEFGIMGGDALAMDALKNSTIERCAQAAEEYLKSKGYKGEKTAAAIRKLKDKP